MDVWRQSFNYERPHDSLGMKCPAELYRASERKYEGTPEDLFGRVTGRHAITASNIAKYDAFHGVVIFDHHNPLQFSREAIVDYLDVGLRWAQEAAYRFMSVIAGNKPHYEDAIRALFADEPGRFKQLIAEWPTDVRDHAARLAERAFDREPQARAG